MKEQEAKSNGLQMLPLEQLQTNPDNPRNCTGKDMELLIDSLLVFPKMLHARPIVTRDGVVQGGNMRTEALNMIATMQWSDVEAHLNSSRDYERMPADLQEECKAYWKAWRKTQERAVPVFVADNFTDAEVQQFIIKDNANFGQWDWDALANAWDAADLQTWGVDCWQAPADNVDDILDGLQERGFRDAAEQETGLFQVSLLFPVEQKDAIQAYIKNNGKDVLTAQIVDKVING